ncbi:hypothetical protein BT96DRAFT_968919 [Gymnopus androsaceus JB14]|uniref:Uncharacterized protein n=1 Tax=Gymnopus androsaceus JB14 TaxID=1447944 RepID=A0A6A4IM32_9AGAR|nr:hypothetical protein BT96DRAFT_968919 [Gymnopus androsaceus JB14]
MTDMPMDKVLIGASTSSLLLSQAPLNLLTQNVDLEGNAKYLEHCYQQLQNEFDKAKHLNEQYLKEKNDLIQERSDLTCLAEFCVNVYVALLKQKLELEQVNEDLELTIKQQDIKMNDDVPLMRLWVKEGFEGFNPYPYPLYPWVKNPGLTPTPVHP